MSHMSISGVFWGQAWIVDFWPLQLIELENFSFIEVVRFSVNDVGSFKNNGS